MVRDIQARLKELSRYPPELAPTWKESERLAESTANIDYGCNFIDGYCAADRVDSASSYGKGKGCCNLCKENFGCLEAVPPYAINKIEELFNLETGFWREGKGCVLPRKWRSAKCLGHICMGRVKVESGCRVADLAYKQCAGVLRYYCTRRKGIAATAGV